LANRWVIMGGGGYLAIKWGVICSESPNLTDNGIINIVYDLTDNGQNPALRAMILYIRQKAQNGQGF